MSHPQPARNAHCASLKTQVKTLPMAPTPAQFTIDADGPIAVQLRRNARAKRLTLRVSQHDGAVTLTLPPRASLDEALRFAQSRAEWIRRHLPMGGPRRVMIGDSLPLRGTAHVITAGTGRGVRAADGALIVPGPASLGPRLAAYLKVQARDDISRAADHYARLARRPITRLTLRDTRSRWGSCTSGGALMFSWRLVMAPPPVLHYVAAHEVAHLLHMDHSPAFWAEVARLFPDHASARQWLRLHGSHLQRIDFTAPE